MARIEISSVSNPYGTGELQLQGKVAMSGTLTSVTDNLNNASPLKLSTGGVQVASTLQITTNSNPYIDAEDGSGNNRFQVGRDPSSQVVNVDFASNPTGGTNMVGGIRTYTDGVNLSQVMSFRKDGFIGMGTTNPSNQVEIRGANFTNVLRIGATNTGRDFLFNPYYATNTYGGFFSNESGNITLGASLGTDNGSGIGIILGAPSGTRTALLQIKGTGSTSATTSLLVQNSGGTQLFRVYDDGTTDVGTSLHFYPTGLIYTDFGSLQLQGASRIQINNSEVLATANNFSWSNNNFLPSNTTSNNFQFVGNGSSFTNAGAGGTSIGNVLRFNIGLSTSVGNVTLNHINIDNTINTTSGTTLQRGFYYNPTLTLTTGFTHYGIQTTSGGAYINTTTPQASACLQADSTTQGFLPPRMTTIEKNAIVTPAIGLMVFDTTLNRPCFYNGAWVTL